MAENPRQETDKGEWSQPAIVSGQSGEKKVNGKDGDERSLVEFLLAVLAKGEDGSLTEKPPRIPGREDYYAALEQRQRSSAALSGDTSLP